MTAERTMISAIETAIHRTELRLEQQRAHILGLGNHPQEAAIAREVLKKMLATLARLRTVQAAHR